MDFDGIIAIQILMATKNNSAVHLDCLLVFENPLHVL